MTNDTADSADSHIVKPTYFNIISNVGAIQFTLTAPGDSTLHPLHFYREINSKLLAGQSLASMHLDGLSMVTDAQPDYQAYWIAHSIIYQVWKTPASATTFFQRIF